MREFNPPGIGLPPNIDDIQAVDHVGKLPCPWCGCHRTWFTESAILQDGQCYGLDSRSYLLHHSCKFECFSIRDWMDWRMACAQDALRESESLEEKP